MNKVNTIKKLMSERESFLVATEYVDSVGSTIYRAISLQGQYISQAYGDTLEELISELEGFEEVKILEVVEVSVQELNRV